MLAPPTSYTNLPTLNLTAELNTNLVVVRRMLAGLRDHGQVRSARLCFPASAGMKLRLTAK